MAIVEPTRVVYVLHFDRRYRHAGHYVGSADDLDARLAEHAAGRGARLLQVVREHGIGWQLARTLPGDRRRERRLKATGGASRYCPMCGIRPRGQIFVGGSLAERQARVLARVSEKSASTALASIRPAGGDA